MSAIGCFELEPIQKRPAAVLLDATDAATLARLIPRQAASALALSRCATAPTDPTVRFFFAARTSVVADFPLRCQRIAVVGTHGYRIPSLLSTWVLDEVGPSALRRAPDVRSMTLDEADAHARRSHLTMQVDGFLVDAASKQWSVLLEQAHDNELDVIVSVPSHRAACRIDQLGAQYLPSEPVHSWADDGAILVRSRAASWCELKGTLRLLGLDRAGSPTTDVTLVRIEGAVYLSPRAAPVVAKRQTPASEFLATIRLEAEIGDPSTVRCTTPFVVPHTWRVSVAGGTFTIPNGRALVGSRPGAEGLVICGKRVTAGVSGTP